MADHREWLIELEREGGYEYRTIAEFSGGAQGVSGSLQEDEARRRIAEFDPVHDKNATIHIQRRRVEPWEVL
jgi:hypothetical protein